MSPGQAREARSEKDGTEAAQRISRAPRIAHAPGIAGMCRS